MLPNITIRDNAVLRASASWSVSWGVISLVESPPIKGFKNDIYQSPAWLSSVRVKPDEIFLVVIEVALVMALKNNCT